MATPLTLASPSLILNPSAVSVAVALIDAAAVLSLNALAVTVPIPSICAATVFTIVNFLEYGLCEMV